MEVLKYLKILTDNDQVHQLLLETLKLRHCFASMGANSQCECGWLLRNRGGGIDQFSVGGRHTAAVILTWRSPVVAMVGILGCGDLFLWYRSNDSDRSAQ